MARRPLTSGTVCRLRYSLMIIVAEPVPFGHHWFLVYIEKEQKKMFKKSFSRGLLSLIFFIVYFTVLVRAGAAFIFRHHSKKAGSNLLRNTAHEIERCL